MSKMKGISCCEMCRRIWNWILQLSILSQLIALFILLPHCRDLLWAAISIPITYVIYVINCLCSPTFSYLRHKHKSNSIHQYMQSLFYTPATIRFNVVCYHYETRYYTTTDSNGNTTTRSETNRVNTHYESEDFVYYSWRDISGIFLLNTKKFLNKDFRKAYIKLKLDVKVDFADDITRMDYQIQKDNFYNRNRYRDQHMDFTETTLLNGLNTYNMVRVSDMKTHCINKWCFVLFTLIFPFAEFFKIYVNLYCEDQEFDIKKIVSTRFNLNLPEYYTRIESELPKLVIYGEEVLYNQPSQLIHDSPVLPTENEINNSEQYRFVSIGGQIFEQKENNNLSPI